MKKRYEAPELYCDEYVSDTMIASSGGYTPAITARNGSYTTPAYYECMTSTCEKNDPTAAGSGDVCQIYNSNYWNASCNPY